MTVSTKRRRRVVNTVLESREPARRSFVDYRGFIKNHYDGFPGALTKVTGMVTGHEALAGQLIRPKAFDVRGSKRILDAGCGDGRYSKYILRWADSDAVITAFDLSSKMLKRAKKRLKSNRVAHIQADLTRLPFQDRAFDTVVCGWVIEHLPDPRPGLRELARILEPGGKLLLMATEDTFTGAVCSRLWHCRTYNRQGLRQACLECGFTWQREHWFSRIHERLHMGGILVELRRI